jgi:hypothetical protein
LRACLLSLAAAACAALTFAGTASAVTDTYDGVAFSPFTIAPGNADCVDERDPVLGWTKSCDPVNVLFPGQTLDVVVARLEAAGWTVSGGGVQYLQLTDPAAPVPVEIHLGLPDGTDPTMRYHVRLWQADPTLTVGAVHHEHGEPHKIDLAWDAAEAFLAVPLCGAWCGQAELPVQSSMQTAPGMWRGWPNDGIATVIPTTPPVVPQAAKPKPTVKPKAKPKVRRKHVKHYATRSG